MSAPGRTGRARFRSYGWSAALLAAAWLAGVAFPARAATADSYPQRAVRLIIPFPPGGAGDILGRMVSPKLSEALGQPIVIDNRGGGMQVIATQIAATAQPDGYTLFLASTTHGINPGLLKKLPYDSVRDFTTISLVATSPLIFVAHSSLGVVDIKGLIAAARSKPGQINYGSPGTGTGGQISVELLKWMAGIDLLHVPYQGAGPALVDLLAGRVQVMCVSPLPALPHLKSGRLRGLATTGKTRARVAPDLPTVAESGVPGYQSGLWYILLGPAGMRQPVANKINADLNKALQRADLTEQLLAHGAEATGGSPREAAKFLQSEIDRWTKVIQATGIKPD